MPIAEFDGDAGWGYDGVNLFAPFHPYGTPDDLRRFVDRAHGAGIAVILDVVYNHFGPSGNSMFEWSPYYRSAKATDWGEAIDFDGPHSAGVRELFVANAGYWIDEFHLDGLRLDATQSIHDSSPVHVLAEITRRAREAGRGRRIFLVGENEPQDTTLLQPPIELDALWNDDYHHTARVALTGVVDGYLHDYRGTPQELVSAIRRGFLYQGQPYPWQKQPRGTPTRGLQRHRFVNYLENHDQIANLGFGERLAAIADPATLRALTALTLLAPNLPMLFQGQEAGSTRPWHFFVDHCEDLRDPVRKGRAEFVAQFARLATPEAQAALLDPCDAATLRACVLDPAARSLDNPAVRLHRDLLRLRRDDPAFTDQRPEALDGAVLGERTFALRYFQPDPMGDRLLLVNLGFTFTQASVPEPLIAPPRGAAWRLLWSSEAPTYGGHGTPAPATLERLALPRAIRDRALPRGLMTPFVAPRRVVSLEGDAAHLHEYEWLVGNGLGGYASGTLGDCPTRRYHGLLIAALPNPAGRVMMLNTLAEVVRLPDNSRLDLGWVEPTFSAGRRLQLVEFELESGLPVWRFRGPGVAIERRIAMAYGHNTTVVTYRLLEGRPGPPRAPARAPVPRPRRPGLGRHPRGVPAPRARRPDRDRRAGAAARAAPPPRRRPPVVRDRAARRARHRVRRRGAPRLRVPRPALQPRPVPRRPRARRRPSR